ncbi:MAG: hypothetical protein Q4G35_08265 [Propionibacteriaceae bacterium]|nr:hypothetical protein [Propionibacteriaceae bacterium]
MSTTTLTINTSALEWRQALGQALAMAHTALPFFLPVGIRLEWVPGKTHINGKIGRDRFDVTLEVVPGRAEPGKTTDTEALVPGLREVAGLVADLDEDIKPIDRRAAAMLMREAAAALERVLVPTGAHERHT